MTLGKIWDAAFFDVKRYSEVLNPIVKDIKFGLKD